MQRITGYNLVAAINQLPKGRDYNYINPSTKSLIRIIDVALPEGPITIRRWTPAKQQSFYDTKNETISSEMIWRVANAFFEGQPVNIDRVLAGSYNTRSVLESLIAHTPQFYYCYPGRILDILGHSTVEHGHKHILWLPSRPHKNGVLSKKDTNVAISEIPTSAAVYDSLALPDTIDLQGMDIDVARRHAQIQIALYLIGCQLGFRTWIAQNDKSIVYNNQKLGEMEGVIVSLKDEKLLMSYQEAAKAALLIDCIWFKNSRLMPAIMEVEHSTGIVTGLSRMKNFKDKFPPFPTRYVIVAPDEDRKKYYRNVIKNNLEI